MTIVLFSWYNREARERNEALDISSIRVGTADLIEYMQSNEPDVDFTFSMGADTFIDLTSWKWRRSKDVLSLLNGRLLVLHRAMPHAAGNNDASTKKKDEEHDIISEQLVGIRVSEVNEMFGDNVGAARAVHVPYLSSISSTIVRSTKDIQQLKCWLSNDVVAYIQANGLYQFSDDSFENGEEKKD